MQTLLDFIPRAYAASKTTEETHAAPGISGATTTAPVAHSEAPGIHISIKAEELFRIGDFPVTNGLFLSLIILVFMGGGAMLLGRKLSLIPGKLQNAAEAILGGTLSVMDNILGSRRQSERYLPLIGTIFFVVLFSNWLGLFPGVGSIMLYEGNPPTGGAPLFRAPSSDLNFTLALAIVTVIATNILGAVAIGIGPHIGKFLNFRSPIGFFVGILEFVSECARIISFSFRLFGNIFAGEVLLVVISFLLPYLVPLPFYFLEVFVGFIQAFIFAMLALVFIGMAVQEHEAAH
ncbi:MAG: F0F1 ATP synthase subunit A [Candidatus Liptonbacteria bacterium]|nr:F0F1 ATP synthase subunit A [Candidatus Liptonbacteria bacterium]